MPVSIIALIAGPWRWAIFSLGLPADPWRAIRPEWYIKTAIVILGGFLGSAAMEHRGLAKEVMFGAALCAIIEAYLIYWALVYFVARKFFKFSREWAAPLASGISICGVSAAIATGAAIRARPIVPIMVSSLVVIFAVVELLVLPFAAGRFLYHEPMVAGAWMGLAVKTDGAAVAAGAMADSLIRAQAQAVDGVQYEKDWIMGAATTVKVFIDVFIGIWACILAMIWSTRIEGKPQRQGPTGGNLGTASPSSFSATCSRSWPSSLLMAACLLPARRTNLVKAAMGEASGFHHDLLLHDLLLDRRRVEFQEAVGRRNRPAGRRVCRLPVRIHHLDRAIDLLAFLSWHETTDRGRLIWRTNPS